MLLTGLRGVGKTVLLTEMNRMAEQSDYTTIFIEAHEDKSLVALLAPHLRVLFYKLDRMEGQRVCSTRIGCFKKLCKQRKNHFR